MERRHAHAAGWGAAFAGILGAVLAGLHTAGVHLAGFDWASWGLDTSNLIVPALAIPIMYFARKLADDVPPLLMPVVGIALATVGDWVTSVAAGGHVNPIVVVFLYGLADIAYKLAKGMVDGGNAPGGAALKKLAVVIGLLILPSVAAAQLPEPIEGLANPLVVAGANYLKADPSEGSRVRFFMTANVAGVKPFSGVPLYVGGIGIDIRTLPAIGDIAQANGAGLSIPGLTYAFAGSQAVIQIGYSLAFNESSASGIYAGFGFSLTPPQAGPSSLKAKREAKTKAKAKAKKAMTESGPPVPVS